MHGVSEYVVGEEVQYCRTQVGINEAMYMLTESGA
jgi:hypothetical protein